MEASIDPDAVLDYIEFEIFPSQNRYETSVCYLNKKQRNVSSGILEYLLLHSAEINDLNLKGSNSNYWLKPPEDTYNIKWFTKSTLERFLHIIGLPTVLNIVNSVQREILQLDEAQRFHLSLYAKGAEYQLKSDESDCSTLTSTLPAESSDGSKNELLRAMDFRLSALRGELTAAFEKTVDSGYSDEEMMGLEKFSHHFGSIYVRDSLRNLLKLSRKKDINVSSSEQFSDLEMKQGNNDSTRSLSSGTMVKYGASPAKVAQVERLISSDSEKSFSGEEQPTIERSRALIRSASPRMSASPMRRIQIGRSGSRRSPAIGIRSRSYIPARERSFPDNSAANDSDEEEPEQTTRKSENNVRISVQDAIHLFERKQRNQTGDIQNARSLLNVSSGGNKPVLRRWSSEIGEKSSLFHEEILLENVYQLQSSEESMEIADGSVEIEAKPGVASEYFPTEHGVLYVKLNSSENTVCSPKCIPEETLPAESTNINEKLSASSEWNRRTEAELNELINKMVETKPMESRPVRDSRKRQSLPAEHKGALYDHYKQKRDEKLRGEIVRKKSDKEKQFAAEQQIFVARKSELTSAKKSDADKKQNGKTLQKSQKNISPANPKTESPKPATVKKPLSKAASLPATRKSWPSTPLLGALMATPANSSAGNLSATNQLRRSQPMPPVFRHGKNVEAPPLPKSIKSNEGVIKKKVKSTTEKKKSVYI